MRKIYIMLLMSSVVLLTACDMLDIQPTGKVIPQTLAEYRALIATAYKNVPDARGLACFRSDELYVKDDSWEQDRYGKIECWDDFSVPGQTTSFEWKNFYSIMFTANYTIEERNSINEGSEEDINQLLSAPCIHAFPVGKSLRTALYPSGSVRNESSATEAEQRYQRNSEEKYRCTDLRGCTLRYQ